MNEPDRAEFLLYLANPQNWNLYSYVLNNCLALTDPDGREPNKNQAATVQQIVAIVQQTEKDNPSASAGEILQRVDGYYRNQTAGPDSPRYVYTKEKGWIDFRHFFAAANQAQSVGEVITDALGVGVELIQTVTRSTSAFSYEDLGSNAAGADFGDDHFKPNGAPLSEQVQAYMNNLQPTAPTDAPNYNSLPTIEDPGSRTNQSKGSRTLDSSTTSRQQPTKGANSSGSPTHAKTVKSSGNQEKRE